MSGQERRQELINIIRSAPAPVSGAALARELRVSRQVIVQDIALLRASEIQILSTARGYLIQESPRAVRIFSVNHTDGQIPLELNAIVDQGGRVRDVFVQHQLYGKLKADLTIRSRRDVERFMEEIQNGASSPLKNLTSGIHYHTVEADTEEELDLIGEKLQELGVLL